MVKTERQARLCDDLSAAADKSQWLEALREVMRAFGYAYVTLLRLPGGQNAYALPTVVESSLPVWVVNAMTRDGALGDCPVIKRGASSMMPQYWSLQDPDIACGPLVDAADSLSSMGITSGLMVPVHGMYGNRHLMNFAGDRDILPQAALNELGMIVLHALEVYDRLCRAGSRGPSPLTKRELDVVRWTAQGKTSVEIAELLSISEHTVNAYMNNAIRKLDCVNRTQLVAKTIRLGLID
ncbi:LuxR family transcriptional regulator [Agrobacterium tumefaciens]|uniref:helix-turn-helix transcriptional regulator n=1 Tax=Agrobacterium tumefaciens TaxID=358 RepID=UPI001573DA30|nr:LuxR C-terminal-related transcriptional regulator [Agrobacterium tumefaciens]NTB96642.1 LuxR family transcriptional regulator [Agrobacterium tumefaciens]NTC47832.1 LuxR family transcriptional regulator [Agrobacterium tumefaciens]